MAYADDIALLAPTATAMRVMLHVCENYAKEYSVVFNAAKSYCVVYAPRYKSKSPAFSRNAVFTINGNIIETVDNWHQLGHVISMMRWILLSAVINVLLVKLTTWCVRFVWLILLLKLCYLKVTA